MTSNASSGAARGDGPAIPSLVMGCPTPPSTVIRDSDDMDIDRTRDDGGSGDNPPTALSMGANTARESRVADPQKIPGSLPATLSLSAGQPTQGSGGTGDGMVNPVPVIQVIDEIINQTIGPSTGIARDGPTEVPQHFGDQGRHAPPEHASTTPTIQPTASRNIDLPSGPSTLSQERLINGEASHTLHTDINHPTPGPPSTVFPPVTPSSTPVLGNLGQPFTSESFPSLTTPTPVEAGQRRRSRPSNTIGQEIPQMLGEMKDVIGNLAASVDSLKGVVSDLQVGQNTRSGRGRGSRGRRGRGRGGVIGGNQSQGTGGPVADDYAADDESREDEDQRRLKIYKLRVSIVVHVAYVW